MRRCFTWRPLVLAAELLDVSRFRLGWPALRLLVELLLLDIGRMTNEQPRSSESGALIKWTKELSKHEVQSGKVR